MARMARIVIPHLPHHVTQRGNRRQDVFFGAPDYAAYLALLGRFCGSAGVAVWAWCLMPNHVHLLLVPPHPDALRAALAEAHRRYSRAVNLREDWRGYLWQGRFASVPMDERHTLACARYIELNPVRARLVDRPEDWPWSSARAHLTGEPDGLTATQALGIPPAEWAPFLEGGLAETEAEALRSGERTGRPLGDEAFVAGLEALTGRTLARRKPGRKPRVRVLEE
ncbi:MAG TPA: transposase [Stellaceae bacterium]|nr:transposase [Stellaceae bacterium]